MWRYEPFNFDIKDKNKNKSNILMSFWIDDDKLLKSYKPVLNKIEDLLNIE